MSTQKGRFPLRWTVDRVSRTMYVGDQIQIVINRAGTDAEDSFRFPMELRSRKVERPNIRARATLQ
jgi:hypothetical protein